MLFLKKILNFIIEILIWVIRKLDSNYLIIKDKKEYSDDTLNLMKLIDKEESQTGEWKAHQVFARMQRKFPNVKASDLKLEIELLHQKYFK